MPRNYATRKDDGRLLAAVRERKAKGTVMPEEKEPTIPHAATLLRRASSALCWSPEERRDMIVTADRLEAESAPPVDERMRELVEAADDLAERIGFNAVDRLLEEHTGKDWMPLRSSLRRLRAALAALKKGG